MWLLPSVPIGLIIYSYGIENMDGLGGLHGWQWIVSGFYSRPSSLLTHPPKFCIEGIGTSSIATFSVMFDSDYT